MLIVFTAADGGTLAIMVHSIIGLAPGTPVDTCTKIFLADKDTVMVVGAFNEVCKKIIETGTLDHK